MSTQATDTPAKATRIRLLSFSTPQMRAFHLSWMAFFVCFFAWFGIAPLMPVIRKEFGLTPAQVGNLIVASVASTVLARLLIGYLCDRFGPRLTHTGLLLIGALPVIGIGLSHDYHTLLLFRFAIGAIGASFVVTQYHTSVMFAPNCVGTANATTAGWGNMGGGATQLLMPILFAALVGLGAGDHWGWRLAMVVPGVAMVLCGVAYFFLTQDTPAGGVRAARAAGLDFGKGKPGGSFLDACRDIRVWALALTYGACFGVEVTIHNVATLYFVDSFHTGIKAAGAIVGAFGLLAIFARTLGGYLSDRASRGRGGLAARVSVLSAAILVQGLLLILFSRMTALPLAVASLIAFGLFVHMSCGATYAIIPFVNRRAVGSVAGIVGAGGNAGAVLSGLLFNGSMAWSSALLLLGVVVTVTSAATLLLVRFEPETTNTEVTRPAPTDPFAAPIAAAT